MYRESAVSTIVATKKDLPSLRRLLATTGHPFDAGRFPPASCGDLLDSDSPWCLLAFAADRPVGLCVATCVPKLDQRIGFLFIDEIFVVQAWRRPGVGRKLVDHAMRLAGERGLAGVRLLTRPTNTAAQRFYAALGFMSNETLFFERSFARDADQI